MYIHIYIYIYTHTLYMNIYIIYIYIHNCTVRSGMLLASLEGRTGITCLLDAGGRASPFVY